MTAPNERERKSNKGQAARWAQRRAALLDDVGRLYGTGYSVLAIATRLGVSRGMINSCLADLGIERPSVAEGNRRSAALATPEARRARAEAAHETVRRSGKNVITQFQQAAKKELALTYIGVGEREIAERLSARGLVCEPQVAWQGYNLDIRIGLLAVEVHVGQSRPVHATQRLRRAMELLSRGMSVAYVWLRPGDPAVSDRCIDELVAFYELTSRNPAAVGQYRVVRGDGKIDHTSHRQLDQFAAIAARYCRLQSEG